MATQPLISRELRLQLEQKANETVVHCTGRINAENSEVFQREIRSLIAESGSQTAAITHRIVIDLSDVTHVDSTGLGALLGAWTAARSQGCDLEMANLNPRVEKLIEITKLDTVFERARIVAAGPTVTPPASPDVVPALGPEEAWQQAIDAGMIVHRADPLNCETSIPALTGGVVMPNRRFYVRNHFQVPKLDPLSWRLNVVGLVDRPLSLGLRDLMKMPSQTDFVTLECAGNGRSMLNPRVSGEQWNFGAVSTAEWTGVPLAEVLDRAGIKAGAKELVFRGADSGKLDLSNEPIRFERSLTVDDARRCEGLLAYAMNGEVLPIQHGYPVRLIVPGWYAVASVKWLTEIDVVSESFSGHYQTGAYFFEWQRGDQVARAPVSRQRVRSLITEPEPNSEVEQGELPIRGVAWSGAAPIARVEVRIGVGPWQEARLLGEGKRHSWRGWELIARLEQTGFTVISARATDIAGGTQPDSPDWNRLGYGNNAVQQVSVNVQAQFHRRTSSRIEIDYELLPDEPQRYEPPAGIALSSRKMTIVEVGRTTDILVTNNLKLLFERMLCGGEKPKSLFAEGTSESEKLSIERTFSPSRPDFIPTLATCCTTMLLGRYVELSRRKAEFTGLFRVLIDQKILNLREQFPELPSVLSHAAFVMCYSRYLEHGGEVGLLFNPYLNYIRSLNRPDMRVIAFQCSNEIEAQFKGQGRILSMFSGLMNYGFFVPIPDNPKTSKIPELVNDWFTRNVPLN